MDYINDHDLRPHVTLWVHLLALETFGIPRVTQFTIYQMISLYWPFSNIKTKIFIYECFSNFRQRWIPRTLLLNFVREAVKKVPFLAVGPLGGRRGLRPDHIHFYTLTIYLVEFEAEKKLDPWLSEWVKEKQVHRGASLLQTKEKLELPGFGCKKWRKKH